MFLKYCSFILSSILYIKPATVRTGTMHNEQVVIPWMHEQGPNTAVKHVSTTHLEKTADLKLDVLIWKMMYLYNKIVVPLVP